MSKEELTKDQQRIAETIEKFFNLSESDREAIIRIVKTYPLRKIIVALNSIYTIDRKGKRKPVKTLKEFETIIKKVRF